MTKRPLLYALLAAPFFLVIASPLIVVISALYVIITGQPLFDWGFGFVIGSAVAVFYMILATAVTYRWAKDWDGTPADVEVAKKTS
jgi:ABC-type transport system involved in cytochrome bd biosynthesis fused ATPase/permease subunit